MIKTLEDTVDDKSLIPQLQNEQQELLPGELAKLGAVANAAASQNRFIDYQSRRSEETLRRQKVDLQLFENFLKSIGANVNDLFAEQDAWTGITWGLVETFVKWQINQGYALPSVNVRLSTIKVYSKLAMQAGTIEPQEYALIRSVSGYTQKEQRRIDSHRPITRVGDKKSSPVPISKEQAHALKYQPNTCQGRRDAVLMCLLLDHGLRVGEISILKVEDFDLKEGILNFYRPKGNKNQKHRLSADTLHALRCYANYGDMPSSGLLLRSSIKDKDDNKLGKQGMTTRAITDRVRVLGEKLVQGLPGLSAHDCRHYWATQAARHGTDPFVLQEAGGWSSLAMPRRYVEDNNISNEGVILE